MALEAEAEMTTAAPETTVKCMSHHSEGPCEILSLTQDGCHVLSVGGDGKLISATSPTSPTAGTQAATRLWTHRIAERGALTAAAISSDGAWLATGQENENDCGVWVCPLDAKTGRTVSIPKLVARATLLIRHLVWHGPLLGIAADDGRLMVWDREAEKTSDAGRPRRRDFPTGTPAAGVRCIAFDPQGEFLGAALSSGALAVFRLRESSEHYRGIVFPKAAIGSERITMAWHPDGGTLALPGEPAVRLVGRKDFSSVVLTLNHGHKWSTTAVAWSDKGACLATASKDAVVLWRPPAESPLAIFRLESQPFSLAWSGASVLAVGMGAGSWAQLVAPSLNLTTSPTAPPPGSEEAVAAAEQAATTAEKQVLSSGEADVAPDGGAAEAPRKDGLEPTSTEQDKAMPEGSCVKAAQVWARQEQFQPGATASSGRQHHYLAFNEHGTMRLILGSTSATGGSSGSRQQQQQQQHKRHRGSGRTAEEKAAGGAAAAGKVVVEYSRGCGRSAVREIRAPAGLLVGALGPGLCALGVGGQGRRQPGHISVHLASPWERANFQHDLPPGEIIQALAVGRSFTAVCTAPHRLLRVQTLTGLPLGVLALEGEPVCLAACEDLLLCVTQAPSASPKMGQDLHYALYGAAARERLAAGRLPLSPSATLRWVGFSTDALPLSLDSRGTVRALALSGGPPLLAPAAGEWLPVAELEGEGLRMWPVRAEEGTLHCVEVAKDGGQPKAGMLHRTRGVRYSLPLSGEVATTPERVLRQSFLSNHMQFALDTGIIPTPVRSAHSKAIADRRARRSDGRYVLKFFEGLAKAGEMERAVDVAAHYFQIVGTEHAQEELQMLEQALAFSDGSQKLELSARVAELLQTAHNRQHGPKQSAEMAAASQIASDKDIESGEEGTSSGEESSDEDAADKANDQTELPSGQSTVQGKRPLGDAAAGEAPPASRVKI